MEDSCSFSVIARERRIFLNVLEDVVVQDVSPSNNHDVFLGKAGRVVCVQECSGQYYL